LIFHLDVLLSAAYSTSDSEKDKAEAFRQGQMFILQCQIINHKPYIHYMKPITLFLLKMFLFMGLGFALFTGLIDLIFDGRVDLGESIYRLFFFGTIMTIVMGLSHIYALKRLGITTFTTENLAVKQRRIVRSNLNIQDILSMLKANPDLKKMKATEDGNRITLDSTMTWMGWGEKITIQPLQASGTETEYEITSRPKLATTIVDSGKNMQNVIWVEKMMA
jgi:hypothetical protein